MKRWIFAITCAAAFCLSAPLAEAQCPATITNPLQALVGTWSFKAEGVFPLSYVSAGQFKASVTTDRGGNIVGMLDIIDTVVKNGTVVRQERYQGKYQIFPDCSGGVLILNSGQNHIEYDFWFIEGMTEIFMVSNDPGLPVSGEASKI